MLGLTLIAVVASALVALGLIVVVLASAVADARTPRASVSSLGMLRLDLVAADDTVAASWFAMAERERERIALHIN